MSRGESRAGNDRPSAVGRCPLCPNGDTSSPPCRIGIGGRFDVESTSSSKQRVDCLGWRVLKRNRRRRIEGEDL